MHELLILHCRPGFEKECAAEICSRSTALDYPGFVRTEAYQGYVVFEPYGADDAHKLYAALPLSQLIFARQWFVANRELKTLPAGDRATPIVHTLSGLGLKYDDLWIETPDTNEGKSLSRLARSLSPPLVRKLTDMQLWEEESDDRPRAHVLLTSGQSAYAGYSYRDRSALWPQGIPRLRLPRSAPSRAVLKLEEALLTFLTPQQREIWVREGRTAVDLGAAPGGWSWLLVRNGLHVTAVDNGSLIDELESSAQVEHIRADGFTYRPDQPVHWLVCDIVEQPRRVAQLMAEWYAEGKCERAIFNLKLPMKKRFDETQQCLQMISGIVGRVRAEFQLRAKQLFHDREEVTVYLGPVDTPGVNGV